MENENKRKCKNWLADFMAWTIPRSEAKESYIFWTGLYTLSCVLRRHVKVSKNFLGSWEVYPYMYILFVGPSGNRKTTTTSYNIELLDEVGGLVAAPDQISVAKLASTLVDSEECSMYINAGELSEFMVKSGNDMYSFLTKAFDGSKRISVGTHLRDIELAEKPCINFLGATTPEWLGDNLPQSVLDGGFGSRCIFVYEEELRRRKLDYTDVDVQGIYDKHHNNLVNDLKYIANNLFGEFTIDPISFKKLDEWYQDGSGIKKNPRGIKMKGYYERKPAYVMKIAMLLKIAEQDTITRDDLILNWKNFEESINVIEQIEKSLHNVFGGLGKNVYKMDMKMMFEYIRNRKVVSLSTLKQEFQNVAEPEKLNQLINGLSSSGLIEVTANGDDDAIVKFKVKKEIK